MASRFINGARYSFGTTVAAAVPITAFSNAANPIATTGTPPALNDIVILTSGWSLLNDSVVRVGAVTANSFVAQGIDTLDLVRYPAGQGAGSHRRVTAFTELSQVRDIQTAGGDQNFFQFQYIEDPSSRQRQRPTFKAAMSITVVLDFDPLLPWYVALIAADQRQEAVVMREQLPGGDMILYFGFLGFNKEPTKTANENMTVSATFSLLSDSIRYGA